MSLETRRYKGWKIIALQSLPSGLGGGVWRLVARVNWLPVIAVSLCDRKKRYIHADKQATRQVLAPSSLLRKVFPTVTYSPPAVLTVITVSSTISLARPVKGSLMKSACSHCHQCWRGTMAMPAYTLTDDPLLSNAWPFTAIAPGHGHIVSRLCRSLKSV
ncbi:hypothetical protein BaRGS_00010139 [Batillaria attramentaria]|uniref:Uncharacterized protein n=1 Tax=Batillaria attramentaria TaxID=370345 RepID=A0ABD0LFU4_9CAEN